MAPRLRPRKGLLRDEVLANQQALRAGVANTTGLPALPTELLLEIVSYLPSVPIPKVRTMVYPDSYLERIKVLQALSQMCRSLRSVFLPLTWQRIDVCATHRTDDVSYYWNVPKLWKKDLATELVRQLEIVTIRDPTLAPYVKIVNVFLTDYCSITVIPEFVRCLALFPNLHTIQILGDGSVPERVMDQAFIGRVFPTVHTIVVPKFAYAIVKACPRARSVTNASENYFVFQDIAKYCPDLEELRGFSDMNYSNFYGGSFFQKMRKHFPKTRVIVLDAGRIVPKQTMEELAQFPALQCIEINVSLKQQERAWPPFNLVVKQAMEVLRGMPEPENGGRKCVVVVSNDTRRRHIVR